MSDVKIFESDHCWSVPEDVNGSFVLYSDYDQLRQKLEAAEADNETLRFQISEITSQRNTAMTTVNESADHKLIVELRKKLKVAEHEARSASLQLTTLKPKLESCEAALAERDYIIREAREQNSVCRVKSVDCDSTGGSGVIDIDGNCQLVAGQCLFLSPVPAMPIQDDEWQPIETIPDDVKVLILDKYDGAFIGSKRLGIFFADTSQLSIDGDATFSHDIGAEYLTHWQPLPAKPEVKPSC